METLPMETIAESIPETIPETIAETIAETVAAVVETVAPTIPETVPAATQVIEVVETVDYTGMLSQIQISLQNQEYLLGFLVSASLFAIVVCLCYFCYKFFRIFF